MSSDWKEEFLREVACFGPYFLHEFLGHLEEKLRDVNTHVANLGAKDPGIKKSELRVHWEKPEDLGSKEARIIFDTKFPSYSPPRILPLISSRYGIFENTSFTVDIFNRDFEQVSVWLRYGFKKYKLLKMRDGNQNSAGFAEELVPLNELYTDRISVPATDDISPLISLVLQSMYETMLYVSSHKAVDARSPIANFFLRDHSLRLISKKCEELRPLMKSTMTRALQWVNTRLTMEQHQERERAWTVHQLVLRSGQYRLSSKEMTRLYSEVFHAHNSGTTDMR